MSKIEWTDVTKVILHKANLWASRLFSFVFGRHCQELHNADYEVCRYPFCRIAWGLERLLWYRKKQRFPVHAGDPRRPVSPKKYGDFFVGNEYQQILYALFKGDVIGNPIWEGDNANI